MTTDCQNPTVEEEENSTLVLVVTRPSHAQSRGMPYLSMQIVGHVYDVVQERGHCLDGEAFQIPV